MTPRFLEYYEKLTDLISYAVSMRIGVSCIFQTPRLGGKGLQALRTLAVRGQLSEMRQIRDKRKEDKQFRAFHGGRVKILPQFYCRRFGQRLGSFAGIFSDQDMIQEFLSLPICNGPQLS